MHTHILISYTLKPYYLREPTRSSNADVSRLVCVNEGRMDNEAAFLCLFSLIKAAVRPDASDDLTSLYQ